MSSSDSSGPGRAVGGGSGGGRGAGCSVGGGSGGGGGVGRSVGGGSGGGRGAGGWLPGGGAVVGGACRAVKGDVRLTEFTGSGAALRGRRGAGRRCGLPAVVAAGRRVVRLLCAASVRSARRPARATSAVWPPFDAARAERSRLASASSAAFSRPGHRHRRRLGWRSGLSSVSASSSLSSI